ncbi:hypothetical protein [Paucibacter sp. Y2R2-4]|uniref:hypothetical protein n=1 Tax=Paucibacter sp. Y2R2-4 TaxID=2893553 RepID=UPI0021E3B37D|nr:hypothetical protein [Paucibacter sp. Y2R2-4]MCV2352091.1 hypothetical protein [Paucibacter sp. Y2R2-4]
MITSVAGAAEKTSGTAVRTNAEDTVKRTDSIRAAKPASSAAPESGSSVVEISSEGARRAAQQQAVQTRASEQADPSPIAAPVDQVFSPANEQAPSTTSAANESTRASLASAATDSSAPSSTSSSATSTKQAASTVKEFDDADTNQDYTVSVLERRAYDFLHPSLNGSSEQDQTASLASLEGQKEAQNSRAIDAELKAYTEIAKAGRVA